MLFCQQSIGNDGFDELFRFWFDDEEFKSIFVPLHVLDASDHQGDYSLISSVVSVKGNQSN